MVEKVINIGQNSRSQTHNGVWSVSKLSTEAVVDHLFFRFLTCPPVPEIFAIKVESYQKSRRNLDVFWRSEILEGGPSKNKNRYHPCLATRRLEKSHEDVPTSPEVIGVHTLNFKANFKFSRLELFGGTPVPVGVCAR